MERQKKKSEAARAIERSALAPAPAAAATTALRAVGHSWRGAGLKTSDDEDEASSEKGKGRCSALRASKRHKYGRNVEWRNVTETPLSTASSAAARLRLGTEDANFAAHFDFDWQMQPSSSCWSSSHSVPTPPRASSSSPQQHWINGRTIDFIVASDDGQARRQLEGAKAGEQLLVGSGRVGATMQVGQWALKRLTDRLRLAILRQRQTLSKAEDADTKRRRPHLNAGRSGSGSFSGARSSHPQPSSSSSSPSSLFKGKARAMEQDSTGKAGARNGSPAPTTLPWFAEDLSPEDLALVRNLKEPGGKDATRWIGKPGDEEEKRKIQTILGGHWDGELTPARKE